MGKMIGHWSWPCALAAALAPFASAIAAMPDDWIYTSHRQASQPPAVAIARCVDGSWGFPVKRGRVCAGHRGVAKWLRRPATQPPARKR